MNRFTKRLMQYRPYLYSYLIVGKKVPYKTNLTSDLVAGLTGTYVNTHKKGK